MNSFSLPTIAASIFLGLAGLVPAQSPSTTVSESTGHLNPTPAPCCDCLVLLVNGQADEPAQKPLLPPIEGDGAVLVPVSVMHTGGTNCPQTISGKVICVPAENGKPIKEALAKSKDYTVTSSAANNGNVDTVNLEFAAADLRISRTWLVRFDCKDDENPTSASSDAYCPPPRLIRFGDCESCASGQCRDTSEPTVTQDPFTVQMPPFNANGGVSQGNLCYREKDFNTPTPAPGGSGGGPGVIPCFPRYVEPITSSGGQITSVNTGTSSMEVSPPTTSGFTVTHKKPDGTPYRVTEITKVTDGGIPRRRVDSTFEGTTTRHEQIQPNPETLVMEKGKLVGGDFHSLRQETLIRTEPSPGKRVHRTTVKERPNSAADWHVVSDTETTWEKQIHGWVKTKEILDLDRPGYTGAKHTTTWTYYEPGEPTGPGAATQGLGRLKRMVRHDGYEENYTYALNQTMVASYHAGNPIGKVTTTTWDPITRTETTTVAINGQMVSKSSVSHTDTSTTSTRYTSATQTLVTTTTHVPVGQDFGGKPLKTTHPDGTITTYAYTRQAGGGYTTVMERGASTNGNTVVQGMRGTSKVNAQGKTIESSTQDIESGVVLSQTLATTIDALGRPTQIVHDNDPADYETFTYSCCGLQSLRARDGTVTSYIKDTVDRTIAETTTLGDRVVTRTYNFSPSTDEDTFDYPATTITTTATGVDGSVVQKTVRDVLGRTVSSSSPGPMGTLETTEYLYSPDGLITTQRNPDLGTIITESYPDGRTKSITGTATIPQTYTYDKHNENGGGELTIITSGLASENLLSSVSSYSDLAGRTYKQTRTAPHGQTAVTTTTFNTLGQAETITSSGQPSVRYIYNAEGEQIATWTDRNGDGEFNDTAIAGVKDACTTTQSDTLPGTSAPSPLGDCRRTISTVRTEADEDKVISTTWQSVDGLRSRQETLGVANPATATRTKPLNGASTSTQTKPDGTSVETATSILANGNTQITSIFKDTSSSILQTSTMVSDALGRTLQSTNGRGHVTQYAYHLHTPEEPEQGPATIGQTASVTQVNAAPGTPPGNLVTQYTYTLTQGSGRGIETTLPDTSKQYQESNLLGQTTRQWGSQTNPVKFTYDAAGNRATMTTYRVPVEDVETFPEPGETSPLVSKTTWRYDASGALLGKRDAADREVTHTYDIAGRVLTRTWARGVVTTYSYTAGQLTSVEYFGSVGGWENYRNLRAVWQSMAADPGNHTVQEIADAEAAMLAAKAAAVDATTPAVANTYDRLGRITDQSNGRSTAHYDYDSASLRLNSEEIAIDPDGTAGPLPALTRTLDRTRDNLQRPTGFVLGNEHAVGYGYDVSGRLATLSAQGLPNLPGKAHAFEYTYEPGSSLIDKLTGPVHEVDNDYETNRNVLLQKKNNRTIGTPGELSVIGYTVNELGQREQRTLRGEIRAEFYGGQAADPYSTNWGYDALGQVTSEDRPSTASDRGYSYDQIGNRLTSTADTETTTYSSNALNQYSEINNLQSAIVNPAHDADGNMTTGLLNSSGSGQFQFDGVNQLIRTQSTATSDPTKYAYDSSGRRIAKITYPNGSAVASAATVFLYDGWNLIAEYKLDAGTWALDRTYTWGLDLSGSMQGAGGVGGLLSVTKHEAQATAPFYPIYDGNGNIEAYLDSNGAPAAIYQYDAFGNILSGGGKGAAIEQAKFSHRFSTKYQDLETGLLYFGYRYYHAILGRWINRDPSEESGGMNLYGFVGNEPISFIDDSGLSPFKSGQPWPPRNKDKPLPRLGEGSKGSNVVVKVVGGVTAPVRVVGGLVGSVFTGDIFSAPQVIPNYGQEQCSFLITVGGIRMKKGEQEGFMGRVGALPAFRGIPNPSFVNNPSNGPWGALDFVQITFNELPYLVTIPDLRAIKAIEAAADAAKRNNCQCWCISIVAHSQGTMIVKRALEFVDKDTKKHINLLGLGGETSFGPGDGVAFTRNIWEKDDPVPLFWNRMSPWNGNDAYHEFDNPTLDGVAAHAWGKAYLEYLEKNSRQLEGMTKCVPK